MQVDLFNNWDNLLHGGFVACIGLGAIIGFRVNAVLNKVNTRLDRDEDLKADYPPHRHINGSILYPKDYEPSKIDKLPV